MAPQLKIDFVSDVACPWCAVGLGALELALKNLQSEVQVELHFQPFELNPQMGAAGQDAIEYMTQKYGSSPQQQAQNRAAIAQRGAAVGFTFRPEGRGRIYNTFDAHRLLHWAAVEDGTQGKQHLLKKALLGAYFTQGQSPASHEVLTRLVAEVGLNPVRAAEILASDEFADAVRERERFYQSAGIQSVPAIIINDCHLISGGQPVEVFEQALRQIAGEMSAVDA